MTVLADINVSIVITTYNAADTIETCLASILNNREVQDGSAEIIVVDDRSTDATVSLVKQTGCSKIHLINSQPRMNVSLTTRQQALDLGIRRAGGKVILCTDADSVVPEDWISRMAEPILNGKGDATVGRILFSARSGWWAAFQSVDAQFYYNISRLLNRIGGLGGAFFGNLALRRSLYLDMGGFDSIGFALTEDLAFSRAMMKMGFKKLYRPSVSVSVQPCCGFSEWLDRTRRVSSAPSSSLSLAILGWVGLLPLLLFAALTGMPWGWFFLGVRYTLGLGLSRISDRTRPEKWYFFAWLTFDILAIFLWFIVWISLFRSRKIDWGGLTYER